MVLYTIPMTFVKLKPGNNIVLSWKASHVIFVHPCHSRVVFSRITSRSNWIDLILIYLLHLSCFMYELFQRPQVLGVKKEMRIAELIDGNNTIRKFGISMEIPSARIKVQDAIERNNDAGSWNTHDFVSNLIVITIFFVCYPSRFGPSNSSVLLSP